MSQGLHQRYDFAAASRVERPLRVQLNAWAKKASAIFVEQWSGMSQSEVSVAPCNLDAGTFGGIQAGWGSDCIGVAVGFEKESVTGLVVVRASGIRILLEDMLGVSQSEGGVDEQASVDSEVSDVEVPPLTAVEESLVELILESLAASFAEGWTGPQSLGFEVGQLDSQLNRSRGYVSEEQMLVTGLVVRLGEASVLLQLVLCKIEAVGLLGSDSVAETKSKSNLRVPLESVAKIRVDLQAELGEARLDMGELASLAVGDIVLLEQSVGNPVSVSVNQEVLCFAWPGRLGNRQVIKIESLVE